MSKMSNLTPSTAFLRPLEFLQQHPSLFDAVLADCNYALNEVSRLMQPALTAIERCQRTPYYIQAFTIGNTRFLMTNAAEQMSEITPNALTWIIGRSPACGISVSHRTVSRCHAVIGYHPIHEFYITDLSSSNGTRVNHRQLVPSEQYRLQDGDLLQLGGLRLEFLMAAQDRIATIDESTCY